MTPPSRRARIAVVGLALLAVAVGPTLTQLPATAAEDAPGRTSPVDPDAVVTLGDTNVSGPSDITRALDGSGAAITVSPTAAQRLAARALGPDVSVLWNQSGTPASVLPGDGVLARSAGATPEAKARSWVAANRDLLGISAEQVADLELVNDQELVGGGGHAVLLRQRFGTLAPATDGMVTVGVAPDGTIAYVSSSLVKATGAAPAATLTPLQGWLRAAASVGRTDLPTPTLSPGPAPAGGWTSLEVAGFAQPQLARVRAFARPDGTLRPAIEANVVDVDGGQAFAYRVVVDGDTGAVLFRQNAVQNSTDAFPFTGTYGSASCSDPQTFELTDADTRTIAITAAAAVAVDDIVIRVAGPGGYTATADLLTSPEVAVFTPTAPRTTFEAGAYTLQICPFTPDQVGGSYAASVVTSDAGGSGGVALPAPRWRAFAANPALSTFASLTGFTPDVSVIECWTRGTTDCTPGETHENVFSFGAWDTLNGVPTLTTLGNNATTREAWGSFLTPGGLAQAPVSATREYTREFTDVWNNSGCDPANLVPGGNDIDAVTGNLFTGHNRVHDFSYALGFTERNYNMQVTNGDRGGVGADPEVGNVQAGAVTGGAPTYMGRDNANQITLQDGVPGITNQYLFQPIAAAFYSPCTDGSLDTGIYGHEYTHAISNRMVAGPDNGLTSAQGGAMGESWSDLVAAEYQFENDYLSDKQVAVNPWSLGSYATGNVAKGIRDYAINDNPLNYSDYGFDTTGAEVHADGEIWNGTLWEVRQALVDRWDAAGFRYGDTALQQKCESPTSDITDPQLTAAQCPGNRRWLQLIFDAWLLQPSATDMLQARNAMLAADRMRFGGANQATIASAFARRGMGEGASTPTPDSEDVTPSFRSAFGPNSEVTFTSASAGAVYVGNYEARVTPVAVTNTGGRSATATFTPGIYRMTFVSPTSGFRRFVLTVQNDGRSFTAPIDDAAVNVASAAAGARLIGTTAGSLNAEALIDGTETTNWSGTAGGTAIDDAATQPSVAVALAGGTQTVTSAKVSALLRPSDPDPNAIPLPFADPAEPDPLAGSRFTALRRFALEACVSDCAGAGATWSRFYTSADDAFPGDVPRPVAPDQTMRTFRFAPVTAAAVRLVALENQCTGQPKYAGDQDADPLNSTDCKTASERGEVVHAAELQVFSAPIPDDPAQAPAGDGSPGSGTAGQGTAALPLPGQASLGTAAAPAAVVRPRATTTRTRIRLPRVQQVRGVESTRMKYAVVAPVASGRTLVGKIKVRLDGKVVKRKQTTVVLKRGRVVSGGGAFRVPTSLGLGQHRLRVIFTPLDPSRYTGSRSRTVTLTVIRSRS